MDDSYSYNLRSIRELLVESFDGDELRYLVWEDPQLGDLADEFTPADSTWDMAQKTVEWCRRRALIPYLLDRVAEVHPQKYKQFEAKLKAPIEPEASASFGDRLRDRLSSLTRRAREERQGDQVPGSLTEELPDLGVQPAEWVIELDKEVFPGKRLELDSIELQAPQVRGRYQTRWTVSGQDWEGQAEPATVVRQLDVLEVMPEFAKARPHVLVRQAGGINIRMLPDPDSEVVTQVPDGTLLEVNGDLERALANIGREAAAIWVQTPDGTFGYAAAGTVVQRGTSRLDYERRYVLLPPDADLEWALAVADATWEVQPLTFGTSVDDAGIGDIARRQVYAVNPEQWPEDPVALVARFYPGVELVQLSLKTPEELRDRLPQIGGTVSFGLPTPMGARDRAYVNLPRAQYERRYILLPPDANAEWARTAARATWGRGPVTIGTSADDAGIGDLDGRQVIAINPSRWDQDLEAFYEQYYPGVELVEVQADRPEELAYRLEEAEAGTWPTTRTLERLSTAAQGALRWAEGFRQKAGAPVIYTEYLLAGLYHRQRTTAHRLLTLFDDEATIEDRLEKLVNRETETSLRLADVEPVQEIPEPLALSPNSRRSLLQAALVADGQGSVLIRARHLLAGLLAVEEGEAGRWIDSQLKIKRETLYELIATTGEPYPPLDKIRAASERAAEEDQYYGERVRLYSLENVEQSIRNIRRRLQEIADSPEAFQSLEAPGTVDLLRFLARQGSLLYEGIVRSQIGDNPLRNAPRIQIVSARESLLPLEFVYERPVPSSGDSRLCPNARNALEEGRCTHCEELDPEDAKNYVCPPGFWGLSRVIERHVMFPSTVTDLGDATWALESRPTQDRDALNVLRAAVYAASNRVGRDHVKDVMDVLMDVTHGRATRVDDWSNWLRAVEERNPSLLVLLAATLKDGGFDVLEIGDDQRQRTTQIRQEHIHAQKGYQPPVVLLLGSETQDLRFAFSDAGAAIVLTTSAPMLGRHAAPIVQMLLRELDRAEGSGETFGDALLRLRRRALAAGLPTAMSLVAYGDADWHLSAAELPQPISREEALSRIEFIFGDLLDQDVDAIVHPTSSRLGFDGVIGRQLRDRLGTALDGLLPSPRTVPLGEALVTEAPLLPAHYLIHAPMRERRHYDTETVVRAAAAAMVEADNLGDVQTIAFPSMGTGAARLKPEDVAPKMLAAVADHLEQGSRLQKVTFVFRGADAHEAYASAYRDLGGKIEPLTWPARLSDSSRQAVGMAGALSRHLGKNEVTDRHLLWGLGQKPGGATRELLATAGSQEQISLWLEELVHAGVGIAELQPIPASELDQLPLCATCQQALEEASKAAEQKGAERIRTRHLLAGLLAVPQSEAAGWLAQTLSRDAEVLGELLSRLPEDEALTRSWLQAALLRLDEVAYDVQLDLDLPDGVLKVGQSFTVCVSLLADGAGVGTYYSLSLAREQARGAELSIFLDRKTVHAPGSSADNLPLDLALNGDVLPDADLDQVRFTASALRPGETMVRVDLYLGTQYLDSLEETVQVAPTAERLPRLSTRPRPVPQPDLMLQVRTGWGEDGTISFHHRLDTYRGQPLGAEGVDHQSLAVPADWAERVRSWLREALEGAVGELAGDLRSRLGALGQALYRATVPPEVGNALRERAGRGQTLLLVADRGAWLPWELLHDGWGFLGEHFVLGRWPLEQDKSRPYEFPLGQVSVLQYAGATAEAWTDLLRPARRQGHESLENSGPEVLDGGVQVLAEMERVWGLHLLRHGRRPGRNGDDSLPVRLEASGPKVETEVRTTRLSLRRNRPLVSLGYLSAGLKELTQVEERWGPAYLGAGCSAFVGPLWAVAPEVEAAFLSGFYTGLWQGAALGQAFAAGRRLAQSAAPDSLDWLAYLLMGDPLARPYRPVVSEGYATVEPVGRQVDDPLAPGSAARFRVQLRRTPPVWYEDRVVEVAKEFDFDQLVVHITAAGLELRPGSPIDMFRTAEGDYQGWFTLVAPGDLQEESAHVQVYFVDGERMVHGVMFSQPIRRGT